jgi:hypothetical protein
MGAKRCSLPQCPKAFVSKAAAEKSQKSKTDLLPMNLDNFGAPIFSIDIAGFIFRKIFMQPS